MQKMVIAGMLALAALSFPIASSGQTLEATVLDVEVKNRAVYYYQDFDVSKWGATASPVTAKAMHAFCPYVFLGDITAVNGKPAKGTFVLSARLLNFSPDATPGQAIADITRGGIGQLAFEFLQPDGTAVGTIFVAVLAGGPVPAGGPLGGAAGNQAIVGGTGAFFGARGTVAQKPGGGARTTTVEEDPANRRINGGGTANFLVQIIPFFRPEVVQSSTGPVVAHSNDFSLVSAANPALSGEILSLLATGLGPTTPGVNAGEPFGADRLQRVNSPVEVTVNGSPAEVLYAGGYPGTTDTYQVNFRVPAATTPGRADLRVSAAWIAGPQVRIPVR